MSCLRVYMGCALAFVFSGPLPLRSLSHSPLSRVHFGESLVVRLYSEIDHIHLSSVSAIFTPGWTATNVMLQLNNAMSNHLIFFLRGCTRIYFINGPFTLTILLLLVLHLAQFPPCHDKWQSLSFSVMYRRVENRRTLQVGNGM